VSWVEIDVDEAAEDVDLINPRSGSG